MSTNHPRLDRDATRTFREDVRDRTRRSGDGGDSGDGVVDAARDRDRDDRFGVDRDVEPTR